MAVVSLSLGFAPGTDNGKNAARQQVFSQPGYKSVLVQLYLSSKCLQRKKQANLSLSGEQWQNHVVPMLLPSPGSSHAIGRGSHMATSDAEG